MIDYQVPKVFFCKYINLLSTEAFCVLLRFYKYYLENAEKGSEVEFECESFYKEFFTNISLKDENIIWTELSFQELIIRYYKENVYRLNLKKIREDNRILLGIRKKINRNGHFDFKIINQEISSLKERKPDISDYVNKFVSRYSEAIQKKLIKLIELMIGNFIQRHERINLKNVWYIISTFINEEEKDIEYVCKIFNNQNMISKAKCSYIKGIFKNIKLEKNIHSKRITESLKEYEKKQEESDKNFGIEIAKGTVLKEHNASYQAYLKLKDFEGLNRLYLIGTNILKEQNRENELYTKYEWIKI